MNNRGSIGTGFFLNLQLDSGDIFPLLITNKHVVANGNISHGKFLFTAADENGDPIVTNHIEVKLETLKNQYIPHPDPQIDLCAFNLIPIIEQYVLKRERIFCRFIDSSMIPTGTDVEEFDAVEEILMIGYPDKQWDKVNNMPLVRRGITATHFKYDYNGKSNFVIDAACFPGSSGSPVIIHRKGNYTNKKGKLILDKPRIYLAGVLYGGPQHCVEGLINNPSGTPDPQQATISSYIPNNLGFVVKSENLFDFKDICSDIIEIIKKAYKKPNSQK
jgi:hypothetical protein